MRVLFLSHNVAWRGGFFRAYHWGRYLARRGHEVTIVATSESNRFKFTKSTHDGVTVVKTPDLLTGRLRTGWDPWNSMRRATFLRGTDWDVVHAVDSRPAVCLPALAMHKRNTTLIMDWGDWWGRGGTILERQGSVLDRLFAPVETYFEEAYRTRADGTVVLSAALAERAAGLGVPRHRIARIPHGADVEGIQPRDKSVARKALGMSPTAPVIGYVGVLFKRDATLLQKTFDRLQATDSRIHLCLIGQCNMAAPKTWIAANRVTVTGRIDYDRLQTFIAACDLMVLPLKNSVANRGRWPSKVGDYLAAGRPVVTTDVGDISSLIRKGQCGAVADDCPEALASAIADVLRRSDLQALGVNARQTAEVSLDWRILTNDLETFYNTVRSERQY